MKTNKYESPVCTREEIKYENVLCGSTVQFEDYEGDILWGDEE